MSLVTTPFGATSTTTEVLEGADLSGRRAVVTGATSGLGTETARALAQAGAEVTLAVRDEEAGRKVAARIEDSTGNGRVHVGRLDQPPGPLPPRTRPARRPGRGG